MCNILQKINNKKLVVIVEQMVQSIVKNYQQYLIVLFCFTNEACLIMTQAKI